MLNIGMAEQNTMGIQREYKNRCVIHGIRGGTLRWKGNAYLVIIVSWILGHTKYILWLTDPEWGYLCFGGANKIKEKIVFLLTSGK